MKVPPFPFPDPIEAMQGLRGIKNERTAPNDEKDQPLTDPEIALDTDLEFR